MIRCTIEVRYKGVWRKAVKLKPFPSVEKARVAMYAVKHRYGAEARIRSQYGTIVDETFHDRCPDC